MLPFCAFKIDNQYDASNITATILAVMFKIVLTIKLFGGDEALDEEIITP